MRATDAKVRIFTDKLAEALQLQFANEEIQLLNWGNADNHIYIHDNLLVLIEVEIGQKHPTTNLIKIWPFLEHKKFLKILLVHLITDSKKISKNRLMLCNFYGQKMEEHFNGRFKYIYAETDFSVPVINLIKGAIHSLKS